MSAIVLNGGGELDTKADEVAEVFKHILGSEASVVKLRDIAVADCLGCFGCWIKTPGECVINDASKDIIQKLMHTKLTVFVTPITFGGYSYDLKKLLDRQICRELPFFTKVNGEIHHEPRYSEHSSLIAVGILPKPNSKSEDIFKTLVSRNAINMHAPAYASGIVYADDDSTEVSYKIKALLEEASGK